MHGLKSDDVTVLKYVRLVGHAENHAAFVLEEEQSIFSGDHVLGFGTTVVSDLHDYMVSLHLLLDEVPNRLYEMLCAVALLFFGGGGGGDLEGIDGLWCYRISLVKWVGVVEGRDNPVNLHTHTHTHTHHDPMGRRTFAGILGMVRTSRLEQSC